MTLIDSELGLGRSTMAAWPSTGCSLWEALCRTADRTLLQQWRLDPGVLQGASDTWPQAFLVWLADQRIAIRDASPDDLRHWQELLLEDLRGRFFHLLRFAPLVATGRVSDSTLDPPQPIPREIWREAHDVDWNASAVWVRKSDTRFRDVRVFPVLLGPTARTAVVGRGLRPLLDILVFGDPEVAALQAEAARIVARFGDYWREITSNGGPPILWPLNANSWILDQFAAFEEDPTRKESGGGTDRSNAPLAEIAEAVEVRFKALRDLARYGDVGSQGRRAQDNAPEGLPRGAWGIDAVDIKTGDVWNQTGDKAVRLWRDVTIVPIKDAPPVNRAPRASADMAGRSSYAHGNAQLKRALHELKIDALNPGMSIKELISKVRTVWKTAPGESAMRKRLTDLQRELTEAAAS